MKKRVLDTIIGVSIGTLLILLINYAFDLGLKALNIAATATTVILLNIFALPLLQKKKQESKSTTNPKLRVVIFIIAIIAIMGVIIFIGESLNLGS